MALLVLGNDVCRLGFAHMHRFVMVVIFMTGGLLAVACTQTARLPTERFDHPEPIFARGTDLAREHVRTFLGDRNWGRSGYACIDCHSIDGHSALDLRPAPRLALKRSAQSGLAEFRQSINRCTERYLMRPGWSDTTLMVLTAHLARVEGRPQGHSGLSGRVLFNRACQHCHRPDLAGGLLGRPIKRSRLEFFVRSKLKSGHAALMPGFGLDTLTVEQYQALSTFLLTDQFAD